MANADYTTYSRLNSLNESEKYELISLMSVDKFLFAKIILGDSELTMHYHIRNDTPDFHLVINSDLEGLKIGEKYACVAPRGHAKAQTLDSTILTPDGWVEMRDIHPGSLVIGFDGKPTEVTHESPIKTADIYEVETRDGRIVKCSLDHLWTVQCPQNTGDRLVTKTLKELKRNYKKLRTDKRDGSIHYECTT